MGRTIDRRSFLARGAAIAACSAAAHPFLSTVTLAQAPWDNRLVVLILRGAMDGLDAVRPVGDPHWAGLRPDLSGREAGLPLDGFFALHPALGDLMPMWQAGELAAIHAVSTPYRDRRSHFDGQDMLEAGTGADVSPALVRDGWLNRMLLSRGDVSARTAFAVGTDELKLLRGKAPVANWSPDAALTITPQSRLLLEHVYGADPLFRDAAAEAISLAELAKPDAGDARGAELALAMEQGGGRASEALAAFAAERLYHESRIAAFSVQGWDTHRDQARAIPRSLRRLAATILTLRAGLGPVWDKTCVLAMTEFGRTARQNGSGGTDHGTGGAMFLAGGAIRGGRVLGRWPGLEEGALYDRRDLMPTADVRAHAAWAMRGLFGLDRAVLEEAVFPGLEMGPDPRLLR